MLTYKYTARNAKTGEKISAEIEADSEQAAAQAIRNEGLTPLTLSSKSSVGFGLDKYIHKIKIKDKVLFSRQLSTLINAGLPLVQSLRNVMTQTQNKKLRLVITRIISDVEGGTSFSASLNKHPDVFNRVFVSLVAAGEASGTLDKALERLANQQEKDAEILSKVRGAMIYPLIVIAVMAGVLSFMMIKVIPQVKVIYEDLSGASLPLLTRILITISNAMVKYWWVFLILLIIGAIFTTRWSHTLGGKQVVDKLKLRMWPIGPLFMKVYMARFARTGQTLVASGVPLIQMLDITGESVNNVHIEGSIKAAIEKVKGGKALSDSITGDPNFLPLVPNMLHIGEQSGALEDMMGKIADYYEREVDTEIRNISTIIEPVLMVILGICAFIIVAAVLLPIYGLAGKSLIK